MKNVRYFIKFSYYGVDMIELATITDMEILGVERKAAVLHGREAARAILSRGSDIALLWVSKLGYHKLPGGGLEDGEERTGALAREILEETGWEADIEEELGMTVEIRGEFGLRQVSYVYLAQASKKVARPSFTKKEMSQGFELRWMNIDEALKMMENEEPKDYEGKFVHHRDLFLLKMAYSLIMDGLSSQK